MMRHLVGGTLAAVVLAACSESGPGPGTDVQLAVSWMEWPAAVTAQQHGSIRVLGYHGACGAALVLSVEQSGPSGVSVNAVEHFDTDPPPPCPLSIVVMFDTVLPLPRLVSPVGANAQFTVDAPVAGLGGPSRRGFGFIQLTDQQPDATLQVGGRALVLADSLGCSWARPEIPSSGVLYVLSSDLSLAGGWHGAFISGFFAPALSPRCGQDPLLNLRLVEVDAGF